MKSGGDDDAAELDGHVVIGRFGLRGVPAGPSSVTGHVGGGVPVQRVSDGDHAETDQPERHRPFHGAPCPIAGFTDTHDLAGVSEGLLNSPPRRITGLWVPESRRTSCDLLILVDEPAEAVVSLDLVGLSCCAAGEWS